MSGEPSRSSVVLILVAMVVVLVGVFFIHRIVAHPGWVATDAVVVGLRQEPGPTATWRPFARDMRYLVDAQWADADGVVHAATVEAGPFGYNKLRHGYQVKALYDRDEPGRLRLQEDATSEIFLVVLGIGSLLAAFGVAALGKKLERRVTG